MSIDITKGTERSTDLTRKTAQSAQQNQQPRKDQQRPQHTQNPSFTSHDKNKHSQGAPSQNRGFDPNKR